MEIAGALVLVGAVVGWQLIGFIITRTEAPDATVTATHSADPSRPASSTVRGDQPHGPLRKAKKVSWNQLKTGDCFNGFADTGGWKDTDVRPTRVDCRSMHEEEVTGTFTIPGGRHYPGDNAVEDASDARCEKYFERYVGMDWDLSDYFYDYLTPEPGPGGTVTTRPSAWPMTRTIKRPTRSPCGTSSSDRSAPVLRIFLHTNTHACARAPAHEAVSRSRRTSGSQFAEALTA